MQRTNFSYITDGIAKVVETEKRLLNDLPVEVITQRRNRQNRTIKQLLGHLIDSASNNHQRMVRLQYSKDLLFSPIIVMLKDKIEGYWDHLHLHIKEIHELII